MLTVRNHLLQLFMHEDGTEITVEDLTRGVSWRLDESTRYVARDVAFFDCAAYASEQVAADDSPVYMIGNGSARKIDDTTIVTTYHTDVGEVVLRWIMERDRLRILAEPVEGGATALALPGVFRAEGNSPTRYAIPNGQGVLYTGKGPALFRPLSGRGHGFGFTLSMFGQLTSNGALLVITENDTDVSMHWEKTAAGAVNVMWLQHPSMGRLSYPRETVIMVESPSLTSVCKRYRRYEIDHGRFKNWAEKIAERPQLEKLFGAAVIFLGYHQDPELDYAAQFRRLKNMGIDRAYVYPVYCDSTIDLHKALGIQSIDIRQQVPLLHELGYMAGSFIYITDGPQDEGENPWADLRLGADGKPSVFWQIEDQTWYTLSADKRFEWARWMVETKLQELDAVHYDVLCTVCPFEDYNPAHTRDGRADRNNRRAMLRYASGKGLAVSSEGFWDRMTPFYDMGSTKYAHVLGGEEYCTVPMTMLVYHDAAIHMWWEVDNYNNHEHRTQGGRGQTSSYYWGGGSPRLQSAIDALMGLPPDIFPFGLQYNFVPYNQPKFYLYRRSLDEPLTQEAIALAKPVMALHARIGKLEMVEHIMHRQDGAVQETVFADGTRVIANFANVALGAPGIDLLPPESWRMLEG